MEKTQEAERKVRYAVVGLGPVTQAGVLPAFANAAENCELAAFVSDDPLKHKKLGKRYRVSLTYSFSDYEACLKSGEIDAVYLAVPPRMRKDFIVKAAEHGIHVLCERPLGLTEEECEAALRAASRKNVKLMVAYRLYQKEGNTKAVEFCQAGKIGDLRSFHGVLSTQVRPGDPRLEMPGAGPLLHLAVDAVHMARKMFGAEPVEAFAYSQKSADARFGAAEEGVLAVLKFPGDRLASLALNFNSAEASYFHVFGTKGDLRCDPAFDADGESRHQVTLLGKRKERSFDPRDAFAPMLLQFSDAILQGGAVSTGGADGLADIRTIRALQRSLQEARPVRLAEKPAAAPEASAPGRPANGKAPAAADPRKVPVRRVAYAEPLSAAQAANGGVRIPAPSAAGPAAPSRPKPERPPGYGLKTPRNN